MAQWLNLVVWVWTQPVRSIWCSFPNYRIQTLQMPIDLYSHIIFSFLDDHGCNSNVVLLSDSWSRWLFPSLILGETWTQLLGWHYAVFVFNSRMAGSEINVRLHNIKWNWNQDNLPKYSHQNPSPSVARMITWKDLYTVISVVVPLYVTMFFAYGSVKWWKVFSPEQCAGINKFVAVFAVPLLSFEFISRINPYKLNFTFIAADVVSKAMALLVLGLWAKWSHRGSLDWVITLFSLSTLPNTLVMGILNKILKRNQKVV